ncbi:TetR/AcrR family transcriptional regulator [Streptomyces vinaceus]|uniref:TetR/AcrR family transcriptional regulator n=1 Tax=Streptomyces vinaceus TaxID=1960 RepID=UPI0037F5C962
MDIPTRIPRTAQSADRRLTILDAAERVVAARGLEGLTHRAVAAEAGVPLGAITYYFHSREQLLGTVLTRSLSISLARFAAASLPTTVEQLVDVLTEWVLAAHGPHRDETAVNCELLVAALHRPELGEAIARGKDVCVGHLTPLLGPVRAKAVAAAVTALSLDALVTPERPNRDEVRAVFGDICHLPQI